MIYNSILRRGMRGLLCVLLALAALLSLCSCMSFDSMLDVLMEQEAEGNAVHKPTEDSAADEELSAEIADTSAEYFTVSDYKDGVSVDLYTGEDSYVKIPMYIDGKAVLRIGSAAISDRELDDGNAALNISGIELPDSVESVANGAFSGCRSLKSVKLPFVGGGEGASGNFGWIFGVKDSSGNAAGVPESLESVTAGGSLVADEAFKNCENLKSIVLTEAETVGNKAFLGCAALEKIILPDSVASLGTDVFSGCSSLTTLRLPFLGNGDDMLFLGYIFGGTSYEDNFDCVPDTLRNLELNCGDILPDFAFYECHNLVNLTLNGNVLHVGNSAFYRCKKLKTLSVNGDDGYLGFEDVGEYAFAYCSSVASLSFGASLSAIPQFCFYDCASLRTLNFGTEENVIPSTVKSIGTKAFTNCSSLINLSLSDSVTEIGDEMFSGCSYLSKFVVPDSVTTIGDDAFAGCSNLSSVEIGKGVKDIGERAFSYCTSLKKITIPANVSSLGAYAFANCDALKSAMIYGTLGSLPEGCFFGCSALVDFDFGSGHNVLPKKLQTLGEKAFYGCASLQSIVLADTMEGVPNGFLGGCASLSSLTVPKNVKTIGACAFSDCTDLASVEFAGNSVTELGRECFSGCTALKSISLPDSVSLIGRGCFKNCVGLGRLRLSEGISDIGALAFDGCDETVFSVSSKSYAYTWLLENGVGGKQLDIDER